MAITRWVADATSLGSFVLYPLEGGTHDFDILHHAAPNPVTAGSPRIDGPPILAPYCFWFMLARALSREGEAQMPDVGAHAAERAAEIESVCRAYFGGTP